MNFNSPAISYVFLVIPAFFALTVVGQGLSKLARGQEDGGVALGFGVFLLVLIGAAYWMFIR